MFVKLASKNMGIIYVKPSSVIAIQLCDTYEEHAPYLNIATDKMNFDIEYSEANIAVLRLIEVIEKDYQFKPPPDGWAPKPVMVESSPIDLLSRLIKNREQQIDTSMDEVSDKEEYEQY